MFTSFDEKAFWQAIRDKDYLHLKINTVSTILNDPTFQRGETAKILSILQEQVPEIFEDEISLDYEERLDKASWNKRYFTKLTYWFQDNFAESRIAYIREVGRVVHADSAKNYNATTSVKPQNPGTQQSVPPKQNIIHKPTESPSSQKATESVKDKSGNFTIAGMILAVVSISAAIILLIKAMVK